MVYLSNGNRRMDIPTFSLPTGASCPGATISCSRWCYAKKAERLWKNVMPSRVRNLNDSKRETFVNEMSKEISKNKSFYIRIHESGDFYSQRYLEKWFEICRRFPEKKFLAYTQSYNLDYSKKPSNMVLYWTIWPDSRCIPKTGLKAFVIDNGSRTLRNYSEQPQGLEIAFKCKKGHGSTLTCDKCLHCFEGRGDVIFEVH